MGHSQITVHVCLSKYIIKMFGDHQYFYFTLVKLFQQQYHTWARIIIEKQQNGGQFAKAFPYDLVRRVTDSMSLA